jgi:dihydrofolate reductase
MKVSIIVAMSQNFVIGVNNSLPWKLPEDLKHFKNLTLGKSLIMGRKTFESIGRPLPGRENIIVTRQSSYLKEGVKIANSIEEATKIAQNEIFIAGGAEIYKKALDLGLVDIIYLTLIEKDFLGDTYFPKWNKLDWKLTEENLHYSSASDFSYKFQTFRKT